MTGRWGGRSSQYLGINPFSGRIGFDATSEQIAKVRALYERPGTPGEKQAAAAALRRFGVDPETNPRFTIQSSGPKIFRVNVGYHKNGSYHYEEWEVEASDELDAEAKARKHFNWTKQDSFTARAHRKH